MSKPLADLIRPESIDDIVGQEHLLGENKVLRKVCTSPARRGDAPYL